MATPNRSQRRIIGENIRLQRAAYGYTQEHVAQEAGITQGTLSKLEAGQAPLEFGTALRIARLLDISLDELASPNVVFRRPDSPQRHKAAG